MVGATIGCGVSQLNGLHRMLVDSLLRVKLVTADGKVTRASNVENPDLFWALRGAGSNFGTILEATYRVYDETAPLTLVADFLFVPNASQSILQYFQSFRNNLPAKLSFIFYATYSLDLGGLSFPYSDLFSPLGRRRADDPHAEQSCIIVNAVYAGPKEEGKEYLHPLLDSTPIRSNLTMVPWSNVNSATFFGLEPPDAPCPTNSIHNVYGGAVKQFDISTF
jgi:FAD/FMN-containing dehydrogenase